MNNLTPDQAKLIIALGAGVALLVWAGAVWFARHQNQPAPPWQLHQDLKGVDPAAARDLLAKAGALQQPPWELVGGDAQGAVFELTSGGEPSRQAPSTAVATVAVSIETGDHTDPDAARLSCIWAGRSPGDKPAAARLLPVWLAVLPLIIVGVAIVMWQKMPQNPQPAVRYQAMQIVQLVHILWPPFLIAWLGSPRRSAKLARQRAEQYLQTMAILAAPGPGGPVRPNRPGG
ncbi:MAG: hypothetical protein AAF288_08745 [Planctomycetota bacterium]